MSVIVSVILTTLIISSNAAAQIAVTADTRSPRPGDLMVLTIVTADPAATVRVRAFDRDIPCFRVGAKTWRVLIGIDLAVEPGAYSAVIEPDTGASIEQTVFPFDVKLRSFRTRTLTVDPGFVNPSAEALARIEQEARLLDEIWQDSAPTKLWDGPFTRPVPDPANSAFGTRTILNGEERNPHGGADFRSPAGRLVRAPNTGRVAFAGPLYFTGNTVVIDHGLSLFSTFAHLSRIEVEAGDIVKTAEVVGKVGSTGRVTGPHLHWGVRANGARVDPLSLLQVLGPRYRRNP